MEAMKNRFCPMRTRVKDLLASGELGRIVSIESVQKLDYGEPPSSYLLDPLQGGCLYDMGCYAVGWFEDLAGACEVSSREVRWRDVSGGRVDWADEIRMSVGGIPIHMVCDGKATYESRLTIACERGSLEIERLHRPELAHVKYSDGRMLEINARLRSMISTAKSSMRPSSSGRGNSRVPSCPLPPHSAARALSMRSVWPSRLALVGDRQRLAVVLGGRISDAPFITCGGIVPVCGRIGHQELFHRN
ncbi:MAG: hypothetical protein ACLTYW_04730 [Collinsella sp.]